MRKSEYPINPIILNRVSYRAMSPHDLVSEAELFSLLEAARWAPSSYNNQPWRFIYAKRGSKYFDSFFDLLIDFNKSWCKSASFLIIVASYRNFDYNGKPSRTHNFDAGAAWENFALEGTSRGLVVHGMEGFSYDRAKSVANLPENYDIEAMLAVGKKGKITDLPEELREKEVISQRKPLKEIVFEGKFQ
jgi:nitroreductase